MGDLLRALCLLCLVQTTLNQQYVDLIADIIKRESCLTILYSLEYTNAISAMDTNNPLLILTEDSYDIDVIQKLLSTQKASCVTLLAQYARMKEDSIEKLLNRTTDRNVFVLGATLEEAKFLFQDHFKDSVTYVQPLHSGNLMLYKIVDPMPEKSKRFMMWLKNREGLLLAPGNNFNLGKDHDRSTLKGRDLTVSAVVREPSVTYLGNARYGGTEMEVLNIIARKIGFRFRVREEKFFVRWDVRTKEWTGMVGSVAKNAAEIGLPIAFFNGFMSVGCPVELTPQLELAELYYITPKPNPLTPYINFLKPFTPTVWLFWLAAYIICSIVSFLLIKCYGAIEMSLWDTAFYLFGSLWQQNLIITSTSHNLGPFAIMFAFWTVAVTFKGFGYNGDLRAFILKKEYEKPIDTDEDLLSSNMDLYFNSDTALPDIYNSSISPAKRELYARASLRKTMVHYHAVMSTNMDLEKTMLKEGGASMNTKESSYKYLSDVKKYFGYQPFRMSRLPTVTSLTAWAIPLNQPWAEELKMAILRIVEGGIVEKISDDDTHHNKYIKSVKKEEVLTPYQLEHVAGPLLLLAFGLLVSMMVSCSEICFGSYSYYTDLTRYLASDSKKWSVY